jgi:hypothetical protein
MATASRNFIDEMNDVEEEINSILGKRQSSRYFEGIMILCSFIEDSLTWLVLVPALRNKWEKRRVSQREIRELRDFCNQLSCRSLLDLALMMDLLDYDLYKKIDEARKERNSLIHQYWVYTRKDRSIAFRERLEKLASIANLLVGKLNEVAQEKGNDRAFGLFLTRRGKYLVS